MTNSYKIDLHYKNEDNSITAWVEQDSSLHIRAITSFGDPVELSSFEAKEFAMLLLKFANAIDNLD